MVQKIQTMTLRDSVQEDQEIDPTFGRLNFPFEHVFTLMVLAITLFVCLFYFFFNLGHSIS